MELSHIDHGRPFDWGRASADYARWRDIYPPEFYRHLLDQGLCTAGQRVLDLGTGTGVLPRALYRYGARFTGVDPAPEQIRQARTLAARDGLDIDFRCAAAEDCQFPDGSFDAVTACQCFTYFDHARLAPRLHRLLRPGGIFAVLYMAWLPGEDPVAGQSEELILRYNPLWTGCGEIRHPIDVPADYGPWFAVEAQEVFDLRVGRLNSLQCAPTDNGSGRGLDDLPTQRPLPCNLILIKGISQRRTDPNVEFKRDPVSGFLHAMDCNDGPSRDRRRRYIIGVNHY